MNDQFVQCRTSPLSKLGRYGAIYLYPTAGIVLLIASIFLIAGLLHTMDVTFGQLAVSLALLSGATSLSFFLFRMSRMCYALETRKIAFDQSGFTVRDRTDHLYKWNEIGGLELLRMLPMEVGSVMTVKSVFSWNPLTQTTLRDCLRAICLAQSTSINMS